MQTSIRALYASCDKHVRRRFDEAVWSAGGVTVLWSHCEPGDFDGLAGAARHDLVVVGFGRSELERVLAFEAGADAVHAERATIDMVTAQLVRRRCDGRDDGRCEALTKARSAGSRTYA